MRRQPDQANNAKYGVFVVSLLKKMKDSNKMVVQDHNLKDKSLNYLLEYVSSINSIFDLSNHRVSSIEAVLKILNGHPRLIEVGLRNINLQPEDIKAIFDIITARQQIISLDISNRGSDWLNRFSDSNIFLESLV